MAFINKNWSICQHLIQEIVKPKLSPLTQLKAVTQSFASKLCVTAFRVSISRHVCSFMVLFIIQTIWGQLSLKKLKLKGVAKNVAKFESGSYAGLKYYTVLNSSLTERVDQIDSKTVNKQKPETCVVKNQKPSKSSKQGKPSDHYW